MSTLIGSIPYKIHTFGCKVNTYDSGLLQQRLSKSGFVVEDNEPRVHLLNTCAVTSEATKEAVKLARRLKARDPFCLVVITGCAAQVDTEQFDLPGIDLVVANSHKGDIENIVRKYYQGEREQKIYKSNIFKKEDLEGGGGEENEHTRSFLKIQDGCNSFCTFCVIPFARGKSRSLSIPSLVKKIRDLDAQGVKEVVLTGVHIGDYDDNGLRLEDLLEQVLKQTAIPRIRLTSFEPPEITGRLLDLFSDDRMCRHFHMSIQSANSKVLHDMKRHYTAEQVEEALQVIAHRVPGSFVGMDVIAGFPGETEEEFADTEARLKKLPWTRIHVFPYSQRPGTFAARRADQVSPEEIKRRSAALRRLSFDRFADEASRQIGATKKVLILKTGTGVSRDYWNIRIDKDSGFDLSALHNQERDMKITEFDPDFRHRMEGQLFGQLIL